MFERATQTKDLLSLEETAVNEVQSVVTKHTMEMVEPRSEGARGGGQCRKQQRR